MEFADFRNIAAQAFPELEAWQNECFEALGPLYREWNAKINVISRKDIDGLYLHHVLHSLSIAYYIKLYYPDDYKKLTKQGEERPLVLDLGTGGGFPGIPLAIIFPGADFVLCDSVGKKITVATEVAGSLKLPNVRTVNARAESLSEKFDFVVSRAVTSLDNFYPWVRGKFSKRIFYLKGGDVVEEISDLMSRFRMQKGSVGTWRIDSWLKDEYFDGKLVIDIRK